jgi:superfamily II RNA helicase
MNTSFWNAQRRAVIAAIESEYSAKESARLATAPTAEQIAEFEHRDRLQRDVKLLSNAAKRKVAQELEQWNARHMTAAWRAASTSYVTYKRLTDECMKLKSQLDDPSDPTDPTTRLAPILGALVDWGALESVTTPKLTRFGILATEVNESNPLLIAKLYDSQLIKDTLAEHIVIILASTLVDRESIEKTVHPYELPPYIPDEIKETLVKMDTWGQDGAYIDSKYGIQSSEYYWSLSTFWAQIAYDWIIEKKSAAEIAVTYDIYEGNLMRGIHKLSAIVNEWISMATYLADVDMLEKMKNVPEMILRDIAVPESLYLRL